MKTELTNIDDLKAQAISSIDNYLKAETESADSVIDIVHGMLSGYGRCWEDELYDMRTSVTCLLVLLGDPEVNAKYSKLFPSSSDKTPLHLNLLTDFFTDLIKDKPSAEIRVHELEHYITDESAISLKLDIENYNIKNEIAKIEREMRASIVFAS